MWEHSKNFPLHGRLLREFPLRFWDHLGKRKGFPTKVGGLAKAFCFLNFLRHPSWASFLQGCLSSTSIFATFAFVAPFFATSSNLDPEANCVSFGKTFQVLFPKGFIDIFLLCFLDWFGLCFGRFRLGRSLCYEWKRDIFCRVFCFRFTPLRG